MADAPRLKRAVAEWGIPILLSVGVALSPLFVELLARAI
jgi:hypothetical protein